MKGGLKYFKGLYRVVRSQKPTFKETPQYLLSPIPCYYEILREVSVLLDYCIFAALVERASTYVANREYALWRSIIRAMDTLKEDSELYILSDYHKKCLKKFHGDVKREMVIRELDNLVERGVIKELEFKVLHKEFFPFVLSDSKEDFLLIQNAVHYGIDVILTIDSKLIQRNKGLIKGTPICAAPEAILEQRKLNSPFWRSKFKFKIVRPLEGVRSSVLP